MPSLINFSVTVDITKDDGIESIANDVLGGLGLLARSLKYYKPSAIFKSFVISSSIALRDNRSLIAGSLVGYTAVQCANLTPA